MNPEDNGIGASGRSKPDPSEPWRYACPECEGLNLHKSETATTYGCRDCGWRGKKSEAIDRSTNL